jgi:hypothetical protein
MENVMRLLNKLRGILRLGLLIFRKPGQTRFVVHPRFLSLASELDYDNVEELIEALEGSAHK